MAGERRAAGSRAAGKDRSQKMANTAILAATAVHRHAFYRPCLEDSPNPYARSPPTRPNLMKTRGKIRCTKLLTDPFLTCLKRRKIPMRIANRRSVITLGAALVLTLCLNSVRADQPTVIPALYNGKLVYLIPGVNPHVVGVDHPAIASKAANPLYVVIGQDVSHVLSTIPGVAGYNPWWDVLTVQVLNGRDVSTHPFLSEKEILTAEANGEVWVTDLNFILLCQVISW